MLEHNFVKEVLAFPEMLEGGIYLESRSGKIKPPKSVFIAGMGGSAAAGIVLRDYFKGILKIPIFVIRDYSLPSFARPGSLLIAVSYSGNTEETLSVYKEARKRSMQVACIAAGGKLESLAVNERRPFIKIPQGLQPRSAFPYIIAALLEMFGWAGLSRDHKKIILAAKKALNQISKEAGPGIPAGKNFIKRVARQLAGAYPIIFASSAMTQAAGYRLKCQLNENAKTVAHLAVFPELNHNEMVGLSKLNKKQAGFKILILRDEQDDPRIQKRISITSKLINVRKDSVFEIWSSGENLLARMLSLIFQGDLLSMYLAGQIQVDPADISIIENLKKELKR